MEVFVEEAVGELVPLRVPVGVAEVVAEDDIVEVRVGVGVSVLVRVPVGVGLEDKVWVGVGVALLVICRVLPHGIGMVEYHDLFYVMEQGGRVKGTPEEAEAGPWFVWGWQWRLVLR
jgi:hypothetical protein